jgi:hypothetical protein
LQVVQVVALVETTLLVLALVALAQQDKVLQAVLLVHEQVNQTHLAQVVVVQAEQEQPEQTHTMQHELMVA